MEGAGGHRRESARVEDREEQTERAASGYAHAQDADALKADALDSGALLTDDLRARHAMCVVVEAQELPHRLVDAITGGVSWLNKNAHLLTAGGVTRTCVSHNGKRG